MGWGKVDGRPTSGRKGCELLLGLVVVRPRGIGKVGGRREEEQLRTDKSVSAVIMLMRATYP